MSQWVPSPKGLVESQESKAEAPSSEGDASALTPSEFSSHGPGSGPQQTSPGAMTRFLGWSNVTPFFLSAFFYLSAFFAIFSPLPILMIGMKKGRSWAWLSALSNAAIVAFLGGSFRLFCFFIFVVVLSLTLMEFIHRRKSIEKSAALTLMTMAFFGIVFVMSYSLIYHVGPVQELSRQISEFVDYLTQSVSTRSTLIDPSDADEWKRSLLLEFPSALAIFALVLIWANLLVLLKVNPNGLREKLGLDATYFKKWKTPEFLVWPTIFFGVFLVADFGVVSEIALNGFKFLMAIYAIQGLSVLSYFLDLWGVRGIFRWVGFSLSVFLMMPLVLSLGFFDLWFDFRSKFRQS